MANHGSFLTVFVEIKSIQITFTMESRKKKMETVTNTVFLNINIGHNMIFNARKSQQQCNLGEQNIETEQI
jgi:hypothetical protein